jgi:hypothetical protein
MIQGNYNTRSTIAHSVWLYTHLIKFRKLLEGVVCILYFGDGLTPFSLGYATHALRQCLQNEC